MDGNFPILKTERLLLRRFSDTDLPKVFEGLSRPEVIRYYGVSFDSPEATKEQMKWFAGIEREGTGIWRAVCSKDNRIFYGAGGLNSIGKHRKAEIGFWLLPAFWGKGIMKEAVPLLVDYGFSKLHLHRIEGLVESDNQNCKNAMSKLDFQHEGTMRDCEVKNGRFISLEIYARLNKM